MDAVLFDMDGVIVDSVSHKHEQRTRVVREEFGLSEFDTGELIGLNTEDKYRHLIESTEFDRDFDAFREAFDSGIERVYTEKVDCMPGLVPSLAWFRDAGVAVGLGSASNRERVDLVIDRFDLRDRFDTVVSASDIEGPSKPDPGIYLRAASNLGVEPGSCVVVEDSTPGVAAARNAGMYCVGYEPDGHPEQDLGEADEILSGPDALLTRLKEIVGSGS